MPSFFVVYGTDQGRRFEFDDVTAGIGRGGSNQVKLGDTEVSRYHAEVRRDQGYYVLLDLGSSNGMVVNGQRVESHELVNGDELRIGKFVMVFLGDNRQEQVWNGR